MEDNKNPSKSKQLENSIKTSSLGNFVTTPNSNSELKDEQSEKYVNPKSKFKEEKQQQEVKEFFKEDFEKSIEDLRTELKTESQDAKKEFLTFFGLFASFMTFLSIEVQIFKTNNNINEILGISILILSFLMFFAIILNDISKDVDDFKVFKKPVYLLTLIFLLVGCGLLYNGSSVNSKNKDLLKQKLENIKKIDSLSKEIKTLNIKIEGTKSVP